MSLLRLNTHLTIEMQKHDFFIEDLVIRGRAGSLLSMTRELLYADAEANGFTHILWIDDDTYFTVESVMSLLSRDVDFVAANIVRKMIPTSFCALGLDGRDHDSRGRTGLSEVQKVGLGLTLTTIDSLRKVGIPHFNIEWSDQYKAYVGEDVTLCRKLQAHGYKIYVDNDASRDVAHIGDFAYSHHHLEGKSDRDALMDAAFERAERQLKAG